MFPGKAALIGEEEDDFRVTLSKSKKEESGM